MKIWKYILTRAGDAPVTLTHIPAGWEDKTISFIRHEFYNSVLRSMSLSLRFIFEGKDLLITAYDEDGIFADVTVQIQRYNGMTDTYADYFTGIVDFSKAKITRDYFDAPIIDNQILAKFISRDEIQMNLMDLKTLDNQDITEFAGGLVKTVTIKESNIVLGSHYTNWGAPDGDKRVITGVEPPFYFQNLYFPTIAQYQTNENSEAFCSIPDETNYLIYKNNSDEPRYVSLLIDSEISGTIDILDTSTGTTVQIEMVLAYNAVTNEYINDTRGCPDNAFTQTIDYTGLNNLPGSATVTKELIDPGGEITLFVRITGSTTANNGFDLDLIIQQEIEVISWATATFADSTVQSILPYELLSRLLQRATNVDALVLDSDILGRTDTDPVYAADGEFSLVSALNGFMGRNYDSVSKPFITSIRDFFKSLNAISPVGLWYNETADQWELNPITEYYRNEGIITLGEVSEFERFVDEKYYFNSVKCGYEDKIYYDKQGALATFATGFEFSNNISLVKNVRDFQSKYRGDDFGIIYLREANIAVKEQSDTKEDDSIFWLTLQRNGGDLDTLQGLDNFDTITGVYNSGERMNLDITPKRNLLRHLQELAIPFWKSATKVYKYQNSQFNVDLATEKSVDVDPIGELDDVTLLTEEPLYDPEIYNFTAPVTTDQIAQLMADPHGYVTFHYLGVPYYGHILEVSTEPFDRGGNWTLIKANLHRDITYITNSVEPLTQLTDNSLDIIIF